MQHQKNKNIWSEKRDSRWGSLFGFCCRESVENLIHKHSYARSPIRTYTGDEENLSEDGHAAHSRGERHITRDTFGGVLCFSYCQQIPRKAPKQQSIVRLVSTRFLLRTEIFKYRLQIHFFFFLKRAQQLFTVLATHSQKERTIFSCRLIHIGRSVESFWQQFVLLSFNIGSSL